MSKDKPITPEDMIPDGVDKAATGGMIVRKGTIAAFLANVDILENPSTAPKQKQIILQALRELAPAVIAIGLHKHVVFKNAEAEKILSEAAR